MELGRAHSRELCQIHLKESLPIGKDPREVLAAFRVSRPLGASLAAASRRRQQASKTCQL